MRPRQGRHGPSQVSCVAEGLAAGASGGGINSYQKPTEIITERQTRGPPRVPKRQPITAPNCSVHTSAPSGRGTARQAPYEPTVRDTRPLCCEGRSRTKGWRRFRFGGRRGPWSPGSFGLRGVAMPRTSAPLRAMQCAPLCAEGGGSEQDESSVLPGAGKPVIPTEEQ